MKIISIFVLLMLSVTMVSAAQLYRWVDDKGKVEWRDTPPPSTASKVEQRNISGNITAPQPLPYSVQQAAKNFPVTLWANNCGPACDQARAHLAQRGVPYTEMDPVTNMEAFQKATAGAKTVPVVFIGSTRLQGYLVSDWDNALDFAGYPKQALVKAPVTRPPAPAPAKPADQPAGAQAAAK
jgi:glutaredoxin